MSPNPRVILVFLMFLGLVQISWESNCVTQVTDAGGRVVLPGLFELAWVLNDSEILVIDGAEQSDGGCGSPSYVGGRYGLYSVDGSVLLPLIYEGIYPLRGGVYKVNRGGICDEYGCDSGEWAVFFARQKKLTAFAYSEVERLDDSQDVFALRAGCHCGHPDHNGEACDEKKCRSGLIDREGRVLAEPIYSRITSDEGDGVFVLEQAGRYGVMNPQGKWLLPLAEGRIELLGAGRFARFRGQSAALFDDGGKALTGYNFSRIEPFHGGLAHAYSGGSCSDEGCLGGAWFILDASGKTLAGPLQAILWQPKLEVAGVLEAGRWTLRDLRGKRLNAQSYDSMILEGSSYFGTEQYFKATAGRGETTLLDKKGRVFYQGAFSDVISCGALFCYRSGGKVGLCTNTGQVVLAAAYDQVEPRSNGTFELESAGKSGWVDARGKVRIPPQCNRLEVGAGFAVCKTRQRRENPEMGRDDEEFVEQYHLFDTAGRRITEQPYDDFNVVEADASTALRGKDCFRIRDDGSVVFSMKCSQLRCSGGLCAFESPGKDGLVDNTGRILLEGPAVSVLWGEKFHEVREGRECSLVFDATAERMYIDLKGNKLGARPPAPDEKPAKFQTKESCGDLCRDGKSQSLLLDGKGRTLDLHGIQLLEGFDAGLARAVGPARPGAETSGQGREGVIDASGRVVVPLKYTVSSNLESGYFRVYEGGQCETNRGGMLRCACGVWKILDSQGKEVSILKDLQAPNPIMGGTLLVSDLEGDQERLIDVHGKKLYEFRSTTNYEHHPWQSAGSHPWFYEDASGRDGEPVRWISVKGQVLGRPDSEMRVVGERSEAVLLEQENRGNRFNVYAKTGDKILSVTCGTFLTTATGFVCEERSGDKSGGALAFYDRQGKKTCALQRVYSSNAALPACGGTKPAAPGTKRAAPGTGRAAKVRTTAFALEDVVRDHVIVRDTAGNFAALTPQGRWVSGFGRSWLIPTGEKNVYYFDPGLRGGKRVEAAAFGLKDGAGRVLTTESFRVMGPFHGGLTAVARRTRDDAARNYEGLLNAQGKLLLDDPDATIVAIGGGAALVTLEKPYPGTSAKQVTTIVLDAQGRERVRMPDTDVRRENNWSGWLERTEYAWESGYFVFTVHGECALFPDYRVCRKTTRGLMDLRGRVQLKNLYASVELLGDGLFAVRQAANCRKVNCADIPYSIVNLRGEPLTKDTYSSVKRVGDAGLFEVQRCGN